MNVFHIKYAVEVAKYGSINKAAEALGMAQPNVSRAIKELESNLGIAIFDRSAKGMMLTPEGKEFITQAQNLLSQLDSLEKMFREGMPQKQKFSVSAPRAAYIAEAFARFSHTVNGDSAEIVFDETSTYNTIKKVISSDCKIGIIRYEAAAEEYFAKTLQANDIEYRNITDFNYVIATSANGKLAAKGEIYDEDLREFVQITHNNPYQATLSASDTNKVEQRVSSEKRIYLLDTAAQLETLSENRNTFMWISPAPEGLLEKYGLIQLECRDKERRYRDTLIYRKAHTLTELEKAFIDELYAASEICKKY